MSIRTATLASYGWLPWPAACALLDTADAVWLGPAGITWRRTGPWPATLPLTTRMHAWSAGEPATLWRVIPLPARGTALVTALVDPGSPPSGVPQDITTVDSTRSLGSGWERHWVSRTASVMFLRPAPGAEPVL
jgi:hypothetical protein